MDFAISVNADHLYRALNLVGKFLHKGKDKACLQDIQLHIDNEGMWVTATDQFRMLSAYLGTSNKEWRDTPSDLKPFALNPEVVKDMTDRLKDMGVKKRKTTVVYMVEYKRNNLSIGTPAWDGEDLKIERPEDGYLPKFIHLINDAHKEPEIVSHVWCGWMGSFKDLDLVTRMEGNRPQLLVNTMQGHRHLDNPPYKGLVMPIWLPR